jgi:hypothetical protein
MDWKNLSSRNILLEIYLCCGIFLPEDFLDAQPLRRLSTPRLSLIMKIHVHDITSNSNIVKRMRQTSILDSWKLKNLRKNKLSIIYIDMTDLKICIPTADLEDGENIATSFSKDIVFYTHWAAREP